MEGYWLFQFITYIYTFISLQFRDFLRRVSSSKLRETNPKCKITSVITCDYSVPTVDVTFSALHRERGMVHTVCISGFHTEHWEFFLLANKSLQKFFKWTFLPVELERGTKTLHFDVCCETIQRKYRQEFLECMFLPAELERGTKMLHLMCY